MGNIKNFNEFNSVNEGLISWAKKTFKPRELDDLVKDIIKKIKSDFKISKVTLNKNLEGTRGTSYSYKLNDDELVVKKTGVNYSLILNDDWVGQFVSEYYIEDLYNFIDKKYKNKSVVAKKDERTERISELRNKYSKYYLEEDE